MNTAERDAAIERIETEYREALAPFKQRFRDTEKDAHRAYDAAVESAQQQLTEALESSAGSEDAMQAARAANGAALAAAQKTYDAAVEEARDVFAARDARYQEAQRARRFEVWEQFHAEHPEAVLEQ